VGRCCILGLRQGRTDYIGVGPPLPVFAPGSRYMVLICIGPLGVLVSYYIVGPLSRLRVPVRCMWVVWLGQIKRGVRVLVSDVATPLPNVVGFAIIL